MTYTFFENSAPRRFKTLDAARKAASRLDEPGKRRPVVLIYGPDKKEVGAMFNRSYFRGTYLLNTIGVWRVEKSGNCRFVKADGSLGEYADDFLRSQLQPRKVLNAATGKIETRRY